MAHSWKRFACVQLPSSALILALAAQAIAMTLSNVTAWRFRADELAMAVSSASGNYRILLLGDSKTSRATERFALGPPSEVANLSTHMFIGLSGSLFLVQRYLETHRAPEHVVLAVSPQLYHFDNNLRLSRYHLWHTFNRPEERSFLKTYHPGMGQRDSLPAILDLQERVVEPFMSLLRHKFAALRKRGPLGIPTGWIIPDPETRVLYSTNVDAKSEDRVTSDERDLTMALVNAAALGKLCVLSKTNGFEIHFVWPPMPDGADKDLESSGALSGLETRIRSIMNGRCHLGEFVDLNKRRTYTISSFQHDLLHLYGDGWEQRYASDLREYLGGLLQGKVSYTTQ
jgi:hypothetical protein